MNNLVTILEKLLAVRKIAAEDRVQAELDDAIQMVLDMLKQTPDQQPQSPLPPINTFPPMNITPYELRTSPYGGFEVTCTGDSDVAEEARDLARRVLRGEQV